KYAGLDKPDEGTVYAPLSRRSLGRFLLVRTKADASAIVPAVRQALRELDPGVPLTSVATIDELVDTSLERPQSLSVLVAAFAIVPLALSIAAISGWWP